MRATHWLADLHAADEPTVLADRITAARALNALLLEAARPVQVDRDGGGDAWVTASFEGLEIVGYDEPFTDEIIDARAAVVAGERTPLTTEQVANLMDLGDQARALLMSTRDVMVAVAATFFADDRDLRWSQLTAMRPAELYLLMEQAGNPERPVRNPIAHCYLGDVAHHPFLGGGLVRTLRVDRDVTTVRAQVSDSPRHRRGFLVVHPQTQGLLAELGLQPHRDPYPTTSVRTLYDPDLDRHYKTSFDAQITSHSRLLHRDEAANAIAATNLLAAAADQGQLPAGLFFLPELAWTSHPGHDHANCLERGGLGDAVPALPDGTVVVPMSSLATPLPFAGAASFFELMCANGSPTHLFDQIVEALVTAHLGLLHLGISHESHAQNTLLVADLAGGRIHGVCLRDVEAIKVDPARSTALGLPTFHTGGTAATHSQAFLDPHKPELRRFLMTAAFTHGIVDSQVAVLAAAAIEAGWLTVEDAAKTLTGAVDRHCVASTYVADNLLPGIFLRRNLAHKGLGLTIDRPYRRVDNRLLHQC